MAEIFNALERSTKAQTAMVNVAKELAAKVEIVQSKGGAGGQDDLID